MTDRELLEQIAANLAALTSYFRPRDPLCDAIATCFGDPTLVNALQNCGATDARALSRFFARLETRGLLRRVSESAEGIIWLVSPQ